MAGMPPGILGRTKEVGTVLSWNGAHALCLRLMLFRAAMPVVCCVSVDAI